MVFTKESQRKKARTSLIPANATKIASGRRANVLLQKMSFAYQGFVVRSAFKKRTLCCKVWANKWRSRIKYSAHVKKQNAIKNIVHALRQG